MPAGFNLVALMSEKEERDQKVDGVGTKVIEYPQRVLHSLFFTPSKKWGFLLFLLPQLWCEVCFKVLWRRVSTAVRSNLLFK